MWTLDRQDFTQRISGDFLSLHDKGGWDVWVPWKICQEMQKCTVSKFPTHPSVVIIASISIYNHPWMNMKLDHPPSFSHDLKKWKSADIQGLYSRMVKMDFQWMKLEAVFQDLADTITLSCAIWSITHFSSFLKVFPFVSRVYIPNHTGKTVARPNQRLRCPPADGPSFTKRSDCGARCGKVHSDVLKKGSAKIPICAFNWGNLHKSCHMAPLPFQSFPPFTSFFSSSACRCTRDQKPFGYHRPRDVYI